MVSKKRLGLVIDLERCAGCWTCAVACKAENNVAMGNWWNRVLSPPGKEQSQYGIPSLTQDGSVDMIFRPYACMHCQNAACVKVCPTGATYKRPDGITAQDYSKCIGCRSCIAACPYNVRVFNWEKPVQIPAYDSDHVGNIDVPERPKGVVEKCTFCMERTDKGELPACVAGCPSHARYFGDLNDPNSEVSKLISNRTGEKYKEEFGTDPSVYYLPTRQRQTLRIGVATKGAGLAALAEPQTSSAPFYTGQCCATVERSESK